jgi:hypothetical protein
MGGGERARKVSSYNHAVLYTASPLGRNKTDGSCRFEICVEKHGSPDNSFSGCLRLGLTTTDPETLRHARMEADSHKTPNSWILDGSQLISSKRGRRDGYPSLSSIKTDSIITVILDAEGNLRFEYDGVDQGVAQSGLPLDQEIWGVIDLYGKTDQVMLLECSGCSSGGGPELSCGVLDCLGAHFVYVHRVHVQID